MGFEFQYQPSAAVVAGVAKIGGAGQAQADTNRLFLQQFSQFNSLNAQQRENELAREHQAKMTTLGAQMDAAADNRRFVNQSALDQQDFTQQIVAQNQQAMRNQDALRFPRQQANDRLMQGIQSGDPNAIQIGLSKGLLAFSPSQKQEIAQIRDAMDRLDRDPRMSPQDRQSGQAMLNQRLNSIRPMVSSPDQRPADINEKVDQSIGQWTDPVSGRTYPVTIDRNGVPKVLELPEDQKKAKESDKPVSLRESFFKDPSSFQKAYDAAYKRAKEAMPILDADTGQQGEPKPEDVQRHLKQMIAAQEALMQDVDGGGGSGDPQDYNSGSQFDMFSARLGRVIPPAEMQQIVEYAKRQGQDLQQVGATLGLQQIPRGSGGPSGSVAAAGGGLGQPAGAMAAQPQAPATQPQVEQAAQPQAAPQQSTAPQEAAPLAPADAVKLSLSDASRFRSLPSVGKDMEVLDEITKQYGYDPNQWPDDAYKKGADALRRATTTGDTLKQPLALPKDRRSMVAGGVYGPIKSPSGKMVLAIWDGSKFTTIAETDSEAE